MRDAFGFNFASKNDAKDEERKEVEHAKFRGIHVSSNGYYGYQLVQVNRNTIDEGNYEFMDVQCNDDADIQFHNFIRPEERLCGEPVTEAAMRVNRKRPLNYDDIDNCKKRRELDTIKHNAQIATGKTVKVDELGEDLLQQIHGCSMYHWQREKEVKRSSA